MSNDSIEEEDNESGSDSDMSSDTKDKSKN